jgi:hypothetical protein
MNKEDRLHSELCKWIRLQHRGIMFNSDMSGVNLHRAIRGRIASLRSSRAMPDLMIFQKEKGFGALFIELKAEGTRLLLKDGERLTANQHICEQAEVLTKLYDLGYMATFACGFGEAMGVINWYLDSSGKEYPGRQYLKSKGITYGNQ